MINIFKNVSNQWSLETCGIYYALGFDCIWNDGKDLTLVDRKKAYQDSNPSRQNENISKQSISNKTSADKSNYSEVCRSCGRKLSSEISRNRGYGSYCYRKLKNSLKNDADKSEELNFVDELGGMN